MFRIDDDKLEAFVAFARAELEANDIEPWFDMFKVVHDEGLLPPEDAWWLCTLYVVHDRVDSALRHFERWPSPHHWDNDPDKYDACSHELYPRATERRNLHGESILKRHQTYADLLAGGDQIPWLYLPLEFDSPGHDFARLTEHMRQIWGCGRQQAFEWAEAAGKVLGVPVDAADGQLWESSGPRKSLEELYNEGGALTPDLLDTASLDCKMYLELALGHSVPWVDFETLVCDFKVMVHGGYFVGRHLTALAGEIAGNEMLEYTFSKVAPPDWQDVPPGLDMDPRLRGHYKRTGQMWTHWSEWT